MRGARRGQPRQQLADRGAGQRVAPGGRDLGEQPEHEGAGAEGGMGNDRSGSAPGAFGPEDDVEVEHARPPAAAGAPAETAFDRLQLGEQRIGSKTLAAIPAAIAKASPARPDRGGAAVPAP